tara:strand:+ start:982 stop:2115 length:1134 start_codon:yes stop_codon:yes gene_type:complete
MIKIKKYFGISFLLISVLIAFFLIRNKPTAKTDKFEKTIPYVEAMILMPQTIMATISSQGVVTPSHSLTLLSEVNTKVAWISSKLEIGSSFFKGDTLIKLEKRDYELALINAESNVLNAKLNLEREKAESDLATAEWNRVGDGTGSDLALRKPQLAQARATLAAAEANLESAQRNLKRTVFVAPFNGRVKAKNIDLGVAVFPGTVLGNIYDTEIFEVRLPITDQDLPFLGLNFDGKQILKSEQPDCKLFFGDSQIDAKIVRAEAEVDAVTRMMSIVSQINNADHSARKSNIAVGQFVQAEIKGVRILNVFVVPRDRVRKESIWVIDNFMKLYNRPVEILRFEKEFAIIGEGIQDGDRLLTSRVSSLINGITVTFDLE